MCKCSVDQNVKGDHLCCVQLYSTHACVLLVVSQDPELWNCSGGTVMKALVPKRE